LRLEDLQLENFLTEGEFVRVMFEARWRLIRAFADARSAPGGKTTPGYIVGLDERLSILAQYIQDTMSSYAQRKIYSTTDLPPVYRQYSSREQGMIAARVRLELFKRILLIMREANQLWYIGGEWSVPQSAIDDYRRLFRAAKESYRNQRCFHGRPNRDRRREGVMPGVSVGATP